MRRYGSSLVFLLLLVSGSSAVVQGQEPAVEARPTLHVSESVGLPVSPTKAWKTVRDFDAVQNWYPGITEARIVKGKGNAQGTVRLVTSSDGAKTTEQLLVFDDPGMSYRYKLLDSPLPVTSYVSIMEVVRGEKGGSIVNWYSSFKAKEGTDDADARKAISDMYTAGLNNLKAIAVK